LSRRAIHDLAELYEAHADGLLAFLCGRLKDAALAEDILHDVFIAFHRHAVRIEIASPKAYLYRIADRLSLNARRHHAVAMRAHAEIARNSNAWSPASVADVFQAEAAKQAMNRLTDEERDVLILRVYGDWTFQEISDFLDLPLTTVFKRHARAILQMQQALNGTTVKKGDW
jgi:RNA polymerase sigma factor (sigma-70 family)